ASCCWTSIFFPAHTPWQRRQRTVRSPCGGREACRDCWGSLAEVAQPPAGRGCRRQARTTANREVRSVAEAQGCVVAAQVHCTSCRLRRRPCRPYRTFYTRGASARPTRQRNQITDGVRFLNPARGGGMTCHSGEQDATTAESRNFTLLDNGPAIALASGNGRLRRNLPWSTDG